jgi:hypothetical protein
MNDAKFKLQIGVMQKASATLLTKQMREIVVDENPNREQIMVLVSETNDELQQRMLRMLQSKQFFDLSKHMQTLQ